MCEDKKQIVHNYEKEIDLLKFENTTLKNEFQNSESNFSDLNGKYELMALDFKEKIQLLEKENISLKIELENSSTNYINLTDKFNDKINNLIIEKSNLEKTLKEMDTKKIDLLKLESEFKTFQENHKQEVMNLNQKLEDKDIHLANLKGERETYIALIKDSEEKVKNLEEEILILKNKIINEDQIKTLEKENIEKQDTISTFDKEINKYQKALSNLEEKNIVMETEKVHFQNELKRLNLYISDMQKEKNFIFQNFEKKFKNLEKEKLSLQSKIEYNIKKIEERENIIKDLNEQIANTESVKTQLIEEHQKTILQKNLAIEDKITYINKLEIEINNLKISFEELKKEKAQIENNLKLKENLEIQKTSQDQVINKENLNKIIEQENHIKALNKQIANIESIKSHLTKEHQKMILQNDLLLEKKNAFINKLEIEIKNLRTSFEDLKKEKMLRENHLEKEVKLLKSKENIAPLDQASNMAHIKESLDEIKTQKDELQSKYEKVKKILSHYVKKDKINQDRLNNMVTASTQVDSVLEACTCSNQNTVAPETKLKLAEEQLNEIKINFQKEQASLISKNQNLETDYAMLKDLYRQIIVDYNNYLRNNEINTLSVNEENDEEMDEISKLKQELKLKELINHTNWLDHSRVLEICYKETDELAIKLSQKEKKIEEMSIELRKLQTIHNHCHKDDEIKESKIQLDVLKNDLLKKDKNLEEVTNEFLKLQTLHNHCPKHDEIKESKKQLDVLKNVLLKKDKNLEEVTNEFRKLQAVHNHCLKDDEIKESKKQLNILKHELEEITNEFQKLQAIHNHCVTYDEIKKLQKKIEILNNELIKKETNYTFLKIHNKTLTLQFAKEKRNNPDISDQNLEIPEEEDSQDESCGVEDNTTTHLTKEINRLNKLVSCKDMVYSMHWNQHLFMLEELYQEKEKLESQLSNRNNEIEKITELNKSTENRENMSNKNQKDESTQTNIENNTPSIHKNEQNVIVINKELEDCQIKIEDLEKRNQMLTNLCAIRQRKIDQLLDQVPVGEDN